MTLDQRQMAIGMLVAGMKVIHVARHFRFHESTIRRLKNRHHATGGVADRPRSGRPRKTSPREDRYIVTSSRRNRFMSSTQLVSRVRHATGTRLSDTTVRNRLHAARLRGR
ncbi:MAG: helix-turn-helix domain-containing protein [Sedimenticola sp.]